MGINSMHITNIERKIKDFNSDLLNFKEQFVIIPYLASGFIDYSNFGQVDGQRLIDNFETYKRLWTGNDSFTISWKDSVIATNTSEEPKIKINYQIGDAIMGWLENHSSNVEIKTDASFEDYKAQTSEKSFTFRINANEFNLDTNWEFMFFKVPEISKRIIFRVESLDREYLGRDLMCYVLTLKALNQELASTGRAKQQNVMPNSPGQGYYDVQVVEEFTPSEDLKEGVDYKPFYGRWLVADKSTMFHNPCKKVVIKAFGLCGFSNCAFWGRKVRAGGDFREFGTPHWIFPTNLTNASTYTLYRTQSEQTNYYMVVGATPVINYNQEVFNALKGTMDPATIYPSQGLLIIDEENTLKTNPKINKDGVETQDLSQATNYKYQLFGQNQIINGSLGYRKWEVSFAQKTIETDMISGCAQYYNIGGTKNIEDVMFDNFWTQKNMITLPLNRWNTLNFGWTIGSAFAASVAKNFVAAAGLMLVGITANIIQKVNAPKFTNFNCLMPSSLVDFMLNEAKGSFGNLVPNGLPKNYIKLDYFLNDENNAISKIFNTSTINTSFEAELTDRFISKRLQGIILETTVIGQTHLENGHKIFANGQPFLLNGDATLVNIADENEGFIIDEIHLQALFKGDYSIEFLDKQGSVIWSGVFQSQGKWTGSLREINTWIRTSIFGRENTFLAQPLPWPKTPAELNLIGLATQDIYQEFGSFGIGKVWDLRREPLTFKDRLDLERALGRELIGLVQNRILGNKVWYGNVIPNSGDYQNKLQFSGEWIVNNNWRGTQQELQRLFSGVEITFGTKWISQKLGYQYETKKNDGLNGSIRFDTDLNYYFDNNNTVSIRVTTLPEPTTGSSGDYSFDYNIYQRQSWTINYQIVAEGGKLKFKYQVAPAPNGEWGFAFKSGRYVSDYSGWKTTCLRNPNVYDRTFEEPFNIGFAVRALKIIAFPPK